MNSEAAKEGARRRARTWYHANKEKAKATRRAWVSRNKAKVAAASLVRTRAWRASHHGAQVESNRQRYKVNRLRAYVRTALRKAQERSVRRGVPFALSLDECLSMLTTNPACAISGLAFELFGTPGVVNPFSPSLDRIVAARGYVPDNVRFILHGLNSLKGIGDDADLLRICLAVAQRAEDNNA